MNDVAPGPPSYNPRTTRFFEKPSRRTLAIAAGAVAAMAIAAAAAVMLGGRPTHRLKLVAYTASGAAELRKSENGSYRRWRRDAPVKIVLDDSLDAIGPEAKDAVRNAFGAWISCGARLPAVAFDTGHGLGYPSAPDGVSTVIVAAITTPGHENDVAITMPVSDALTGEIHEADIVINANQPIGLLPESIEQQAKLPSAPENPSGVVNGKCPASSTNGQVCEGRYDLQNVITHELGHFFGLGEDRDVPQSTMFACSDRCEVHKRALTQPDTGQMVQLYQSDDEPVDGGVQCSAAGESHRSWGAIVFVLLGAVGLCRRRCSA